MTHSPQAPWGQRAPPRRVGAGLGASQPGFEAAAVAGCIVTGSSAFPRAGVCYSEESAGETISKPPKELTCFSLYQGNVLKRKRRNGHRRAALLTFFPCKMGEAFEI